MTEKKTDQRVGESKVKIFSVPFSDGGIQENITIITTDKNPSKEKIINKAFKFHEQGNISEALKYYLNFINQGFEDYRVFFNFGGVLEGLGKSKEAELFTRKAIQIRPDFAEAYSNLGNILKSLGKSKESESAYRKAIELKPQLAESHSSLGTLMKDFGNLKEAELFTRKAIQINPNFATAHYNLGIILKDLGKLKDAELSTRKAIQINPNFAEAYSQLGNILKGLGNIYDAINSYKYALKIDKNQSLAKFGLIESKGLICDWSEQENQTIWLDQLGIKGFPINPHSLFCYEDSPLKNLKRAQRFNQKNFSCKQSYVAPFNKNKKIHIGYFSADFMDHATMYLISPLFKLHDKSEFEIYLYSFPPKEDKFTEIAKNSGCFFRDVRELSTIETVQLARKDNLDIAIDLKGYSKYCRMNIFAHRVASIQINYLGYPGSLGAKTIDYIIADNIIIPDKYEKFYSEKVIKMPSCYQCNDDKKEISIKSISRNKFNIPEKAFVFICFNSNKKITPREFEIWMRLLRRIKGSVLWLYQSNNLSKDNLRIEAEKRDVNQNRLIFANTLPLKEHLARYTLGDLALDTFNCNGHTTTSDALWAGLPVLTKIGESFSARVSASLLTSLGITELITHSQREYEEKALEIASNPETLKRLKDKVAKLRNKSPLYNSKLFTKDLEKKFKELVKNQ